MSIYRIGAHESQVLIWLAWKRFHGKDPATVKHPLSVATLKNHLGSLRRALFECNCPDLPPWAKWKDKHGACVLNQLFEWKLQDARSSLEKPQQEKTFLVSSGVELYCLKVPQIFRFAQLCFSEFRLAATRGLATCSETACGEMSNTHHQLGQ